MRQLQRAYAAMVVLRTAQGVIGSHDDKEAAKFKFGRHTAQFHRLGV